MFLQLLFVLGITLSAQCAVRAQDTAVAVASQRYEDPSFFRRLFIGRNYRELWSMPVAARKFRLDMIPGGLKVEKLGGGMQTKSLRLEDRNGEEWVLRTIDKTVDKALESQGIKSKLAQNVAQDMISAAQPYGALVVPPLANALGVLTADPILVYVPANAGLGEHQKTFEGTLCLLERRAPVYQQGDEVKKTEKVLEDLKDSATYRVDTRLLLQARLLDMLISDWDRHGGQWRWGYHRTGSTVTIYPIPVDHDQAFFHSTGILVPMVRPFAMKHLVGFREESTHLKTLNRKEWDFDKTMLGSLSEAEWRAGIETFQRRLTDSVLLAGVRRLPPAVYNADGESLFRTLQSRRNTMADNVLSYYRFLQHHEVKPKADIAKADDKGDENAADE